jgi:hypothetical protein
MHTLNWLPTRLVGRARLAFALSALWLLLPGSAAAQLRPLVPDMLDNLGAINRIGEAVALEDYEEAGVAARRLITRASRMQYLDLAALGFDPKLDPQWDAYLIAQRMAAEAIETAARQADGRAVLEATGQLLGNACLGCHSAFRDADNRLSASVLFMTTLLASWRHMNRGLLVRDFTLVGQRAREVHALSRVMTSDQVLEDAFGLGGSKQRRLFREFLLQVTEASARIDVAAREEDAAAVLGSARQMWSDGCIACHEKFRR